MKTKYNDFFTFRMPGGGNSEDDHETMPTIPEDGDNNN